MPKPGPARRDPPPTRRGGGTGRIRQKSSAWPPPRGPAHPSREGGSCPHAVASSAGSYCLADFRRGGGWGVQVPQGPPLRALEKAFSPRARRAPHTIARPFGDPREWEHSQKVGSQKGGGVCGMGKAHSPCERPRSEPGGQESVLPPGLPFRLLHVGGGVPRPESQTGTPPSHLPAHRGRSHDHMQPSRSREKHGACHSRAKGCPHWHTVRETHDKGST